GCIKVLKDFFNHQLGPAVGVCWSEREVFPDGNGCRVSIDRSGRAEHDVFYRMLGHDFTQDDCPRDVVVVVHQGDSDRFTHRLKPCEMYYGIDLVVDKDALQGLFIKEVCTMKHQRSPCDLLHALERLLFGVHEVVHYNDLMPRLKEFKTGM